jgi:hypothetical protein
MHGARRDCTQIMLIKRYNFDITTLDITKYDRVTCFQNAGKRKQKISSEAALNMVSNGKARIRNSQTIVEVKTMEPFYNYILEREDHKCHSCREEGTQVAKLPEYIFGKEQLFACFCNRCLHAEPVIANLKVLTPPQLINSNESARMLHKESDANLLKKENNLNHLSVYCNTYKSEKSDTYDLSVTISVKDTTHDTWTTIQRNDCDNTNYSTLCAISFALAEIVPFFPAKTETPVTIVLYSGLRGIESLLSKGSRLNPDPQLFGKVEDILLILNDLHQLYPHYYVTIRYLAESNRIKYYRKEAILARRIIKTESPALSAKDGEKTS